MAEGTLLADRYSIPPEPHAQGGHARLYRGFDFLTREDVAVKIFEVADGDPEFLRHVFGLEVEAYSKIPKHQNLAVLQDFGYLGDRTPYLVVEWCDGGDLQAFFGGEAHNWDELRKMAIDVLAGLEQLHALNYVHRDLKPRNVLVNEGTFKLADFGTTRIREVTDLGKTVSGLGTPPYSPPELGIMQPTPAYDVYSFGVMVIELLAGRHLANREEVLEAAKSVDCPAEVVDLLLTCISQDTESRPQSAGQVLASLSDFVPADEEILPRLAVDVSSRALSQYRAAFANSNLSAADLLADLSPVSVFSYASGQTDVLRSMGQTVMISLVVHSRYPWVLAITGVSRPPQRLIDIGQKSWYRYPADWISSTTSPDQAKSGSELNEFLLKLSEHQSGAQSTAGNEPALARKWRRILEAKRDLANRSGVELTYTSFRTQGNRVAFSVQSAEFPPVGEQRLVRSGARTLLRGEVESAVNGEVILYVPDGSTEQIPKKGRLEFDSELTRSKLERERRALDRVFVAGARRSDLGSLLANPSSNRSPVESIDTVVFKQENLDPAKQLAVHKSLISPDLFLVQGPPGTGKTTYISELVAQTLGADPDAKIVLASQTHTALDHALEKVQSLLPDARFLRIGSSERLADAVEPWSVGAQLELWRQESALATESYIAQIAEKSNLSPNAVSVPDVASNMEREITFLADAQAAVMDLARQESELRVSVAATETMVNDLLRMLETVETASEGSPGVGEVVDHGLALASRLESTGGSAIQLLDVQARLEQSRSRISDLETSIETSRSTLRELLPESEAFDDSRLIAGALTHVDEDVHRLNRLRELREDWLDRFGRDRAFEVVLIGRAQVVATTCVALTGMHGAESIPFDLCVIDEASKATPTELLVPLASSNRWVFVGDHKQLPPFLETGLTSPETLERFDLTSEDVRLNLFQMLAEHLPSDSVIALNHQHRMAPAIGDLISKVFYEGALTSEPHDPKPHLITALGAQVVWLDTKDRSNREIPVGTSFRNPSEASAIVRLLERLDWVVETGSERKVEVVVLAGYTAQVREIASAIASTTGGLPHLDVKVATVDSYQGQEADVCVVSLTRSNPIHDLGFVANSARLNVALSRARDGLVIVGNSRMATGPKQSKLADVYAYISSSDTAVVTEA